MSAANKNFLLNLWLQKRVTATQIEAAYTNGKITEEERDEILSTQQ